MDLETSDRIRENVGAWNEFLHAQATEFRANTMETSVGLFSSHEVLIGLLGDPEEYDLCEDDTAQEGGRIWLDELHLTSEVHDIFAEQFVAFTLTRLESVVPLCDTRQ